MPVSDDASKEETDSDNAKLIIEDKDESMDIAMHLPPMQRQLFMRIRQQQLHHDQQQQKEEPMESEDSPSPEDSKTAEEKCKTFCRILNLVKVHSEFCTMIHNLIFEWLFFSE